ncbi:MAG: EamA/RhaT family transporter, partial [Bacteroidetes bacterium]
HYIAPFGFILLRCLGAVSLFWITGLFVKEKVERQDLPKIALAALFGIAINQLFFFKGLNYTNPINAAVIMTSTPILVLIVAAILIKERITLTKASGIAIGLVGTLMILLLGKELTFGSDTFLGDLMVWVNASSYGVYLVLVSPLMRKYHPLLVIKWIFLFGLLMVIPFGWQEFSVIQWHTFPPHIIWATVFVVVGLSFFAYLFNTIALRYVSPSVVSTYIYLQPVIASIFAVALGKDSLDWIKVVSAVLICTGVYLVSRKPATPA